MDTPLQVSFRNMDRSEAVAAKVRERAAKLEVDAEVRFVVAEGESAEGPQASTVEPRGKHHYVE